MEVLQALVLKANLDAGNAEPSPVLAKVKLLSKHFCKFMAANNLNVAVLGERCVLSHIGGGPQTWHCYNVYLNAEKVY